MKKIIIILALMLCLISPSVIAFDKIDTSTIKETDFQLTSYVEKGSIYNEHIMKIGFSDKISITKNDVKYKIVGDVKDIKKFNECVDLSYSVINNEIVFKGEVVKWGDYNVDIQPIIKDSLTLEKYAWFNSSWNYYKQITIDSSQVAADLTNFPVCINITDSDLSDRSQENGEDIVFVNEANDTTYNHEIEYFNSATGELIVWVNITSLSSSVDTKINMYYNNSDCDNQENIVDTWHTKYNMVHHLSDDTSTTILDSTANDYDGSKKAADNPQEIDGLIYKAQDFDEDDDYIDLGNILDNSYNDFSVSGWYYVAGDGDSYTMIARSLTGCDYSYQLYRHSSSDKYYFMIGEQNGERLYIATDQTFDTGVWVNIVAVADRDSNTLSFYVDGNLVGTATTNQGSFSSSSNLGLHSSLHLLLGGHNLLDDGTSYTGIYYGKMDEIRMTDCILTASEISTQYNNINNLSDGGFFSVSGEVSQVIPYACPSIDISNVSPVNSSEISYIDGSLSVQLNSTSLFNYTIEFLNYSVSENDVSNGTFLLNYSVINSSESFIWYVNLSNNCSDFYYWYNFNTTSSGCECHDELMLIYNELVVLNNKDLEESDNVNIELEISSTIIAIIMNICLFYVAFLHNYEFKSGNGLDRIILYSASAFGCMISLISGVYFVGNPVFSIPWVTGIVLILLSIPYSVNVLIVYLSDK